jgi:hypothetical protein
MYQKKFLYIAIGMIVMMLPLILDLSGMNISTPWNIHLWAFLLGLFGLGWCLGAYFFSLKTFYFLGDFVREFEGKEFSVENLTRENDSEILFLFRKKMSAESFRFHFFYVNFPKNEKTDWVKEALQANELHKRLFFVKGGKIYPKK